MDRAIEPEAWCQFRRQHARGEYDKDGAGEEEAELDRREVHRFNEQARCSRKHGEQPAYDQARGCSRDSEATITNQASIGPGDGDQIERRADRIVGFAEDDAVGNGASCGKGCDESEFGAPAEAVIECTAKQWREAGGRGHCDHDQRQRACQSGPIVHVPGDGTRQH